MATLLKEEFQSWLGFFFFFILWRVSSESSSGKKNCLNFTFWKDELKLKEKFSKSIMFWEQIHRKFNSASEWRISCCESLQRPVWWSEKKSPLVHSLMWGWADLVFLLVMKITAISVIVFSHSHSMCENLAIPHVSVKWRLRLPAESTPLHMFSRHLPSKWAVGLLQAQPSAFTLISIEPVLVSISEGLQWQKKTEESPCLWT